MLLLFIYLVNNELSVSLQCIEGILYAPIDGIFYLQAQLFNLVLAFRTLNPSIKIKVYYIIMV